MMDKKNLGKDICERLEAHKPEHDKLEKMWNDCAEFGLGFYEGSSTQEDQTELSRRIFDETAILDGEFFDCALHGMLANPSGVIFGYETEDPKLMEKDEVRSWLQKSTEISHHIMSNTNFHTALAQEFTNIRSFGTAPFYIGEDLQRGLHFMPCSILSTYCAENHLGIVDTVFREFEFTARQAAKQWGDSNLPYLLKEQLNKTSKIEREKKFKFVHAVFPREERTLRSKKNTNMPFASIYVNIDEEWAIAESGYNEMAYATPRWRKPWRSVYGSSPTMNILASIKMLQEMEQTNLIAGHQAVAPPVQAPTELAGKRIKLYSEGVNYFDTTKGKIEEIIKGRGLPISLEMAEARRKIIHEGFYKSVLQLPLDANMTATEVLERIEEQVRVLGPMVGRLFFELFNQAIDRIFGVLLRNGYFPPVPDILRGQEIKIQYLSSIARAQKIAEVKAAMQANEVMAPFLNIFPDMADNLNSDKMFRDVQKAMGVNQAWLRGEDERDALRGLRSQAMEEQKVIEQMTQGGIALKALKEGVSGEETRA